MKKMSLNDLDRTQSEVLRDNPNDGTGCWDCIHSSDGFNCCHKINDENLIGDSRAFYGVPSLIAEYLLANGLDNFDFSDGGTGQYCKLFEQEDWNE